MMTYDVVTLGETMLRLTPPSSQRIEQTTSYEIHVGGSESNVAVGLARLGLQVAWVSRMTKNALGRSVVNAIRTHGVNTSHVSWTDDDRVGLYFYEEGSEPRGGRVIYDRADSAMAQMQPSELERQIFTPDGSRLLHLSGITLAIGDGASATAHLAAKLAKENGWLLSFDINYRTLLWSFEQARARCDHLASIADILFLPLRDAISIFGTSDDPSEAVKQINDLYPQATIVMTLSSDGAIAKRDDNVVHQPIFPANPIGRIGGGDAFVAGFLYAYLADKTLEEQLRWGAATAAYKYSMLGDFPLLDYEPIEKLVSENTSQSLLR